MTTGHITLPIYLTLRLDVLSGALMTLGDEAHRARDGVSVREVRLLLLVRQNPGLSMSRLVELAFMEKTMASKAVTALTQAGLLERRVGDADARQVALWLTRKGKGVAERAHQFVMATTEQLLSILEPTERGLFYDALGKLAMHALALYEDGGVDLVGHPRNTSVSKEVPAKASPKARASTPASAQPAVNDAAPNAAQALPISSQAALKRRPPRARN